MTEVDQCMYCLNEVEGLVLSGVRHWVGALQAHEGDGRLWRHGVALQRLFCRLGGRSAARPFDQFLGLLARNAQFQIDIGVPCTRRVTGHEVGLLEIFRDIQWGRLDAAEEKLGCFLPDDLCARALALGHGFVTAMGVSGYYLAAPGSDAHGGVVGDFPAQRAVTLH